MIVRDAEAADYRAIHALLHAAFAGRAEAELVSQLRGDGNAEIELVAEEAGQIVGHVLFSPLQAPVRALALAPLAVLPERQRKGIGSALVGAGHEKARQAGWEAIFVVGDPAYYGRFGYSRELAAQVESPYSGPYFMARLLNARDALPAGTVSYAPAFQALEE